MKVLHLGPGFSSSGVTAGMFCLAANGFYDQFEDFRILGTSRGDADAFENFLEILPSDKVTFITTDPKSILPRCSQRIHAIRTHIEEFKPDALILSTSGSVIEGRLAARKYADLKIVVFEHHSLTHLPDQRKQLLRMTSRHTDLVWGDTPETIEITRRTLFDNGSADVPSFVVPLTIPDFGRPREGRVAKQFEILSLGRLESQKNYSELIYAAEILAQEGRHFRITIAGKGDGEKDLRALVDTLGISNHVFFAGYQNNPQFMLAQSDIYVQPSLTEGLCLAFIEAAAAGNVIVGTDVGGMKDLGVDNHNMIKIHGFGRQEIAEALRYTMSHYADIASSLSANAICMASNHFRSEVVLKAWKRAAAGLVELCAPKTLTGADAKITNGLSLAAD